MMINPCGIEIRINITVKGVIKRAFVTGGTGLLGSHLLFRLVSKGIPVRALKRKNSNLEWIQKVFLWYSSGDDQLFSKIEWAEGDMLDVYSLTAAMENTDILYHCAATVSFDSRKKADMIRNNVEGTANLVNAALSLGIRRICHVSSNSALGKTADDTPSTEETKWIPAKRNSGYSVSKFFSEAEIWRGVAEGLEAVVIMPSIIIGPGNWNSGSARFFQEIDKGMRFYTNGVTGYVDARDVADAILLVTEEENFGRAKNQKFLLNAENLEYQVFFGSIAEALRKAPPSIRATGLMTEIAWRSVALWSFISGKSPALTRETAVVSKQRNYYDGSKITRQYGFTYHPIREAVQNTAECFLHDFHR